MENSIKQLFFSLDLFAYSIARWAYKIFLQLAEINLSGDETSGRILRKIYVLVFFVMIFIISYSLLTYIVDPDKSSDSKSGTTSLVKKILISLGVIVASPFIFSELYYVQHLVLQSHVIENVILGGHTLSNKNSSVSDDEATINFMIASVYSSFLHPKDENVSSWDCLQDDLNNQNNQSNQNNQNSNSSSSNSGDFTDSNYFKLYCIAYENVYQTGDISKFENFISNDNFTYMWLISFAAGMILAFFTLSFCVNLGVRAFKLLILEILAPVPALIELLPSKTGTLQKYFEEVFKVFAELFIYQAVILGCMWLLTLVPSLLADLFTGVSITRTWAYIILAFSFMRFAREVPQLLTDLFGLKSSGLLRATGLRALNMAAFAGGTVGSTIGRFSRNFAATWRSSNHGGLRSFADASLSGLAGAGSGFVRNAWRARNAQNLGDIRNARTSTNDDLVRRRVQRDVYSRTHGGTFAGVVAGHFDDAIGAAGRHVNSYTGTQSDYERKKEIEQVNKEKKNAFQQYFEDNIYRKNSQWVSYDSIEKSLKARLDAGEDAASVSYTDQSTGKTYRMVNGKLVDESGTTVKTNLESMLRKKNPNLVAEGVEMVQTIDDAHQGVAGTMATHFNAERLYDEDGNYLDSQFEAFEDQYKNQGYVHELNTLRDDRDYQTQKSKEKVAEEARSQTEQAAENAVNNNNNNNNQ